MPRKPNPQLRKIVLEETNDGRDVVRYLKSTFMDIEGAPQLYGLRHKDYARTHKIAAARILARLGLEDGKRYLRRTYVRTPFRRVHPEEEDGPKRDVAASTSELYRLVKKETNDGRDIIIRFVEIMKGYHKEYKPHLRMAAAKELIRQIEFDYDDGSAEPPASEPVGASLVGAHHAESADTDESNSDPRLAHPLHPTHPENPDSDKKPNLVIDDSCQLPARLPKLITNPYRTYANLHCASEGESIYRSIVRRASDSPTLSNAKYKAGELI